MSRFPIAMTAVTLGALAVSATVVVGAFAVIDQRAAQVLVDGPRAVPAVQKRAPSADARRASQAARGPAGSKNRSPAPTPAQTVGSAAAASSVPPQTVTGDTGDNKPRAEARQRARHERRSARRHSQEPASLQASQQPPAQQPAAPAAQRGGQSAFFFPFR